MVTTVAQRRSEAGFTLAEVMVVVLIIGILLAAGLPTFLGARRQAHDVAAVAHLDTAADTAMMIGDLGTSLDAATPTELAAAEPTLFYVEGSQASTSDREISVDTATSDRWVGVVRSASGRCFAVALRPQGRESFESSSCAASSAISELAGVAPTTTTAPTTTAPTTTAPTTLPACSLVTVDSFQQSAYAFQFQLRNTTGDALDIEFVIPGANYQLTNLQFNGGGQNMAFTQSANDDGTFDIVVTGSLSAYQSGGAQQPNGFNGTVTPTSGQPFTRCAPSA